MKTALITGIGRGIGRALADKFLHEGWHVIGTVLSSQTPFTHPELESYQLDLSSPQSITRCARLIADSGARIDVLINNAGMMPDSEETRVVVAKLRQGLEVNLIGTIDLTERIIPLIAKDGHIIDISSQAGSLADATVMADSHYPYHYPAYKITKCAINMYTRTLANRLRHEDARNITVSSVHPGWVKTDMGGDEAPVTPEEAAKDIYDLAVSHPETGQFWYKGRKYPW